MRRSRFPHMLLFVLLAVFCRGHGGDVAALTIYRIGGGDLPPPEPDAPFEFVQLPWEGTDETQHGSTNLLEVMPDFIAPQQLDPTVNLTPLLKERGGRILNLTWVGWGLHAEDDVLMFDEDPNTVYLGDGHFASHGPARKSLIFDFGGLFLIQRVRFYPREEHMADRFVETFIIGISDGDPLKDGTREYRVTDWGSSRAGGIADFNLAYNVTENTEPVIDLELPLEPIQQLLFQAPENTRGIWEIAEFEIYGTGYAPFSNYISNVIDLGGMASLGDMTWSGRQDPGAQVELTMRSGDDDDPHTYWRYTFRGDERTRFDASGKPLTLKSYEKLESGEKAGITHDTEQWEGWSTAYDFAAERGELVGNRPRRYVQFKADFNSTQEASGRLDFLEFAVSIPPVASEALGEIAPVTAPTGQPTRFTYKLLPKLREDDLGFDRIAIDTPARPVSVDAVRISGMDVEFEVPRLDEAGFEVQIPRIDVQRTEELIEVVFQAEVFQFGTVFAGRVFDSSRPHEVRQRVTPGDADPLTDSNRLSVGLTDIRQETIQTLRLIPPAFTPNGDGVNDQVRIECDLLNLVGAVPVRLEVFDLAGQQRAEVFRGEKNSGRFSVAWDGLDGGGERLPPGLYVLRLQVDTDREVDRVDRVVSLVY